VLSSIALLAAAWTASRCAGVSPSHRRDGDREQVVGDQVAGQHELRRHLVEAHGAAGRQRVVLAVHGAGLQRGVEFGEGHRRRVGAERLAQELPGLAGRHAQLQAAHVGRRRDARARTEVHVPRAEIERAEDVHVQLVARHAVELAPDLAGEDLLHVVSVAEQVGRGHHRPGRDLPREVLRRQVRHLHIAALDRDEFRALAEQRGVQVQLDVEVAGEVALEAAHRLGADVLVGEDGGEADAPARLGAGADGRRSDESGGAAVMTDRRPMCDRMGVLPTLDMSLAAAMQLGRTVIAVRGRIKCDSWLRHKIG
jgi:hypothetical protein